MKRALLLAALVAALPASAQTGQTPQTMDPSARPAAGTITARPDRAAGTLDLSLRAVTETGMDDCPGYIDPSAPDAVVEWRGGGPLQISTSADFDATLVVARPDGTWACNDDGDGLQPVVDIGDAARGRYAVWVGAFSESPGGSAITLTAGAPPPPIVPDVQARPTDGTVRVSAGFEMQDGPTVQTVQARGRDALARADLGGFDCYGYINASAPSLVVQYDAAQANGMLAIAATSADEMEPTDLVLLVHTPGGGWECNDDFAGSDPAVVFDEARTGNYVVWVGTYGSLTPRASVGATVTVSESEPDGGFDMNEMDFDFDEMGSSEPYSEGTYSPIRAEAAPSVRIQVGDAPEEIAATVLVVGTNPVSGPLCSGYIASEATADVVMSGVGPLAISASSPDDRDLVMVVHTPDGRWFCSDDADGLDPGVQFGSDDDPTVQAGTYRVWVGPFSNWDDVSEAEDATPIPVTVRAERGELTVSMDDMDFGMDMGVDLPTYTEGTYAGTDLRPTEALQTLRLASGTASAGVQAGGALINPVSGDACVGFIDARPTFGVEASAGESLLIRASADDDDLVMVVRTPTGRWLCSDDADGSDPAVETDEDGAHAVWVGTFSRRPNGVAATASVLSVGTRM